MTKVRTNFNVLKSSFFNFDVEQAKRGSQPAQVDLFSTSCLIAFFLELAFVSSSSVVTSK